MRRAVVLVLVLLGAACGPRALPPEPPIMVTDLRGPTEDVEPAAGVEDCSVFRSVTRDEALASLDASDRAVVAREPRDPPAARPVKTGAEQWKEGTRLLAPLDLLPEQVEAVHALGGWVCARPDDLETTFRLARLHWEHRRFEEAAFYFVRVAERAPVESELGPTAAIRWLEAVSVLVAFFTQTERLDEVDAKIRGLRDRLCGFDVVARHPERTAACTLIGRVSSDFDLMRVREGNY